MRRSLGQASMHTMLLAFLVVSCYTLEAAAFTVGLYELCPKLCTRRIQYCMQENCATCKDCSFCGTFGVRACPPLGNRFPKSQRNLGRCKGNLDLIAASVTIPFDTCGCINSVLLEDAFEPTCGSGKPSNPKPNKSAVFNATAQPAPENSFNAAQYSSCPGTCSSVPTSCIGKTICRVCSDCEPCGNFGGIPCPVGSTKRCLRDTVVVPVTPTFPVLPPGSAAFPSTETCGCPEGTTEVRGNSNRCEVPPPPKPPAYTARGTRSMTEAAAPALDTAAVAMRFEACQASCANRPAYCTNGHSCHECAQCTLCGVPGGQPCPPSALPSGAKCVNNLDVVIPTPWLPTFSCGCRAPRTVNLSTNECVE